MSFDFDAFEAKHIKSETTLAADITKIAIDFAFKETVLAQELKNAFVNAEQTDPKEFEKQLRANLKIHTRKVEALVLKQYKEARRNNKNKKRK